MFLPTTREELDILGWDGLDVILVTGDSYIDSPFIGTAVIGKVLQRAGYRDALLLNLTYTPMRTSPAWESHDCSGA